MAMATLSYNLPADEAEYKAAREGMDLRLALQEHYRYMRDRMKYQELGQAEYVELEAARANLLEALSDYGVDLDG